MTALTLALTTLNLLICQRENSVHSMSSRMLMTTLFTLSLGLRVETWGEPFKSMSSSMTWSWSQITTQEGILSGFTSEWATFRQENFTDSTSSTWWNQILFTTTEWNLWCTLRLRQSYMERDGRDMDKMFVTTKIPWKGRIQATTTRWLSVPSSNMTMTLFTLPIATRTRTPTFRDTWML